MAVQTAACLALREEVRSRQGPDHDQRSKPTPTQHSTCHVHVCPAGWPDLESLDPRGHVRGLAGEADARQRGGGERVREGREVARRGVAAGAMGQDHPYCGRWVVSVKQGGDRTRQSTNQGVSGQDVACPAPSESDCSGGATACETSLHQTARSHGACVPWHRGTSRCKRRGARLGLARRHLPAACAPPPPSWLSTSTSIVLPPPASTECCSWTTLAMAARGDAAWDGGMPRGWGPRLKSWTQAPSERPNPANEIWGTELGEGVGRSLHPCGGRGGTKGSGRGW